MTLRNIDLILEYVRTTRDQQRIIQELAGYIDAANNRITDVVATYIAEGIVRDDVALSGITSNAMNRDVLLRRNTIISHRSETVNNPSTPNRINTHIPYPPPTNPPPSPPTSPPASPPASRPSNDSPPPPPSNSNNTSSEPPENRTVSSSLIHSARYVVTTSTSQNEEEEEETENESNENENETSNTTNSPSLPSINNERYRTWRRQIIDSSHASPRRRIRRHLDSPSLIAPPGLYSTRANIESGRTFRTPRTSRVVPTTAPRRVPHNSRRFLISNYPGAINEIVPTNLSSPVRIRPSVTQIRNNTELLKWDDISGNHQECCPIDLNPFTDGDDIMRINTCGHIFREMNLRRWFRQSPRCPICRFDLRDTT